MRNRLAIAILLVAVYGCVNRKADVLYPAASCMADTLHAVSFVADIEPLLKAYCATTGCHSGSAPQSNLDLDSAVAYGQLTSPMRGYIDTANPTSSLLYQTLTSTGDPMPPTGTLDNCKLKLIRNWIAEGAPHN